jgi:hypothetical protein
VSGDTGNKRVVRAMAAGFASLGVLGLAYLVLRPVEEPPRVRLERMDASAVERVVQRHIESLSDAAGVSVAFDAGHVGFAPRDAGSDVTAAPLSTAPIPKALRITGQTVMRFVESQTADGTPGATADGGVGVRLSGVSGSGLLDGDVVTSVEGSPVGNKNEVALVVFGAIQAGKKTVSAIVERRGTPMSVTVEIPTQSPKTPASATGSSKPSAQPKPSAQR